MKATGIVRRIDDLGRIVIPKEIRRTMRLHEGTPLEIFTDKEGEVILKKYSPMAELGGFAKQYAESLASSLNQKVAVCDRDQIIAAAGGGKKELLGKPISRELEEFIVNRESSGQSGKNDRMIPLVQGDEEGYSAQIIYPIVVEGDSAGAVLLYSREQRVRFTESEQKAAACAAMFLGRQMEG
ncbi:MAG: stage V sporulation protein T [Lachnospiraceae bacterium]|nr:stage V sporulation protein T [Lachnospiraceae bacterium]